MIARRKLRPRRGPLVAVLMLISLAALASNAVLASEQPDAELDFEDATIDQPQRGHRPLATARFPDSLWLSDAKWLDDHTLLVSSRVQAINLWSVIIEWWPEIAGVPLAAMLLRLLLRLLRRGWGQWRLSPDQPHCRRCHYQLTGLTDPDRCPECGSLLTTRQIVHGHHAPFGALAVVGILLAALGVAYFGFGQNLPRHGRVSRFFRWPSTRAMNWAVASSNHGFIRRHSTALARVEIVDARTGTLTRRVVNRLMFNRSGEEIGEPQFDILPDGHSILLMGRRDLLEFNLKSGALDRRIPVIDDSRPAARLRHVILDPQGRFACAILSTRESICIDLATGAKQPPVSLEEVPGWPDIPIATLSDPPMVVSSRKATTGPEAARLELFDLSTGQSLVELPQTEQLDCQLAARGNTVWIFFGSTQPDRQREGEVSCTLATWHSGQATIDTIAEIPFGPPPALSVPAEGHLALLVVQSSTAIALSASKLIAPGQAPGGIGYLTTVVLDLDSGGIVRALDNSSANGFGAHAALSPDGTLAGTWSTGDVLAQNRARGNCTVSFFDLASGEPNPAASQAGSASQTDQK